MLHNNMHILTVLQSKSFKPVFNLSMKKKKLFPYRELHRDCTRSQIAHVYNDCSSDKRECKWIAELFLP